MAKVTYTPAFVPSPVPMTPAAYTLELTAEEMATLFVVTQKVGGGGVRYNVDSISRAIEEACPELKSIAWVIAGDGGCGSMCSERHGSLMFNSDSSKHSAFTRYLEALKNKR